MNPFKIYLLCLILGLNLSAISAQSIYSSKDTILIEAELFSTSSHKNKIKKGAVFISAQQWIGFELDIKTSGRYAVQVKAAGQNATIWFEDYVFNTDDRVYNITGNIPFHKGLKTFEKNTRFGAPLDKGKHPIRIHVGNGSAKVDWIKLWCIQKHENTPKILQQATLGNDWQLVWADEFEKSGLADSTKWHYNVGNWGWGNNELQYYTEGKSDNAKVVDGNLVITAIKDSVANNWTSARLTTQGKISFLYGKIEFRAKVPSGRGTWSAGWMLGDAYRDEISWPYCGEIDVLECVGFEINDSTGNGLNHATCHTPAYYFKKGNQIGADTFLTSMTNQYHTYAIEWYPDVIYGLVDGVRYYTYDKNKDSLEWPFHQPQNIILNLAIGGGWGGAKGIDPSINTQSFIIDYVRVYERR